MKQLAYVLLYLVIGSALRYLLPYVIVGLVQVGLGKPWPKWEWKYLSAFILALIGFGVSMATRPGFYTQLAQDFPIALIAFAYAGNQLSRLVIKAIDQLSVGVEPTD